jgi:putative intracellular protease/amidase
VKVLIVVARQYNGHELWTTLGILQEADIGFEVISTQTDIVDEVTGQPNTIERTIDDFSVEEIADFDGLAIVSGNMADTELYWDHEKVLSFVDEARRLDLVIAAICCSVPTIRNAAIGKKVSFYPLIRSRARLEDAGAIPSNITITVSTRLVTAEHQMATQGWAEALVKVLKGEDVDLGLQESGFTPTGRTERSLPPILERIRGTDTSYRDRKNS